MRFWPVVFSLACSEYDLNTQTGPNAPPHGNGRDGSTLFSDKNLNGATVTGTSGVAIADTDGDGRMTVFVSTSRGLASLEADGTVNWIAYNPRA